MFGQKIGEYFAWRLFKELKCPVKSFRCLTGHVEKKTFSATKMGDLFRSTHCQIKPEKLPDKKL